MKKGITLVLSVVGIILFLVFQLQAQKNVVMAVPVVKEEVYESIKESRTPVQNLTRAELQIGAVTAAWEETEQRYYIPKNMDESGFRGELGGLLDGQPVSLVWKPDSAFDNTDDAVKDRHLFSCMVYSDTEYAELTVLFTGMPVMKIDGDMGAEGTQISLFDPIFGADGEYRSLQSSAYYNIRGNATKRFEKIGYKLELLENDGTTKRKETLLGMRKDDSWQLKALYSDRSKLRDKLSTELWNNIADLTQTKCRYRMPDGISGTHRKRRVQRTLIRWLNRRITSLLAWIKQRTSSTRWVLTNVPMMIFLRKVKRLSPLSAEEFISVRLLKHGSPDSGLRFRHSGIMPMNWTPQEVWRRCIAVLTDRILSILICITM